MARDGLLPKVFSTIHPKFKTPWMGTLLLGAIIAIAAAFLPIGILGNLVSLGTAVAFSIVCLSVIFLRIRHPEMHRPFRVPGGVATAVCGILSCLALAFFNFQPMVDKALKGNTLEISILGIYALVGALIYTLYGFWHSKLAKGIDISADDH
jgi:APA family basic amino acid/polyamine antiporter